MDQERKNVYNNGEITVVWKPKLCIHAAKCVGTLPQVYKSGEKPWINIDNTTCEELMTQINTCPSGALTYTQKNNRKIDIDRSKFDVQYGSDSFLGNL